MLMREIGMLLAYEVANDLSTKKNPVETPRGNADGTFLHGNYSAVVPILRTGLVLADGIQAVLSHTHTGHIGLHRDKDHPEHKILQYLEVLPVADPPDRLFIVADPVIATGDTADQALRILKAHGAKKISFVSVITSQKAKDRLSNDHPTVKFYVAAVDEEVDPSGRVVPGLGSVSELLFGFRTTTSA